MARYCMGVASTTVLAVSVLLACSDAPVDIGEKNPQLAKSDLAAYAADWDGYVEAFQFEDGTDRVRLVLDEQGHGTVRFGERELIAPATDPAGYYPPQSASPSQWQWGKGSGKKLWSGFGYTVRDARIESERIRFGAAQNELFSSYCGIQSSYVKALSDPGNPEYQCLPYSLTHSTGNMNGDLCIIPATTTSSSYTAGDPTVEVNCEQLSMCGGYEGCTCTATSCSVDTSTRDVSLDAALDDPQQNLVGTLMIDNQRLTVRLKRQ